MYNPFLNDKLYLELTSLLEVKLENEFILNYIPCSFHLGDLYDLKSNLGNVRFLIEYSQDFKSIKSLYFIDFNNELLKDILVDSVSSLTCKKTDNIKTLDALKIFLKDMHITARTYFSLHKGYNGEKTLEDILQINKIDFQKQFCSKVFNDFSKAIETLGYTLKED